MKRIIKYIKRNIKLGKMTSIMMLAFILTSCDSDVCIECYTERRVTYFPKYTVEYVEVCYEIICE